MVENVIVDLSHWNQDIDFKLAKEDGILGVMHKATQGLKYVDPTYKERRKAAGEEGCDRDKFNGTLEGLKKFWLTGE